MSDNFCSLLGWADWLQMWQFVSNTGKKLANLWLSSRAFTSYMQPKLRHIASDTGKATGVSSWKFQKQHLALQYNSGS